MEDLPLDWRVSDIDYACTWTGITCAELFVETETQMLDRVTFVRLALLSLR